MSLDFGFLGPAESDSSDEEMYTGGRPQTDTQPPRVDSDSATGFKYQKLKSPTRRELYQVGTRAPGTSSSFTLFASRSPGVH